MYYPRDSIIELIFEALTDTSIYIQECAAQYLRFNLPYSHYERALSYSDVCSSTKIRSLLLEAALSAIPAYRHTSKIQLSNQIKKRIDESESIYEKGFLMESLSTYAGNSSSLIKYYELFDEPILKSAAVQSCIRLVSLPSIRDNNQKFRRVFSFLFNVLKNGSPADKAIIGLYIINNDSPLRSYYGLEKVIEESLDSLTLPNDLETYYILQDVQSVVHNKQSPKPMSDVYTDIDWPVLNAMPDSHQVTIIVDEKPFVFIFSNQLHQPL